MEIQASKRHFLMFFDHYGCLEVIAESVRVVDDEESKPVVDR